MMISRQMIAAAVSAVAGVLVFFAIEVDQEAIVNNIENVIGGLFMLFGVVLGIFRKITSTPLLGWFTKAKK